MSYTLKYVSFAEVDSVCRVPLREQMHLCTCVSEGGGDGEAARSETASLLSYTVRLVIRQFRRGRQCLSGCVVRTDAPVYMRERGGGGRRGSCALRNGISPVVHI
jgi:hypothetical protein